MEASGSLVSLISDAVRTAQRQSSIMRGVPGVGQHLGLAPYGNAPTPNESPDPHGALDADMAHPPEGIVQEIMRQRAVAMARAMAMSQRGGY